MIPKTIHYCWFGGNDLPSSALRCIASWRRYFPEYEIKEWNEDNFDVYMVPYTSDSYRAKKYAFVSDYARFWILYNHGGLYFDTDVEVIRNFDHIVAVGPFMGFELNPNNPSNKRMRVNPGLGLGVQARHPFYREMLDLYAEMSWVSYREAKTEMPTIVDYTTELLVKKGLKKEKRVQTIDGISIYLEEVFCPLSIIDGKLRKTSETCTVHWFEQSWQSPLRKYGRQVLLKLGGVGFKDFLKRTIRLK